MTITRYDGYSVFPKRCSICGRLFVFEPYNEYYVEVGIEHYSLKRIECFECIVQNSMKRKGGDER